MALFLGFGFVGPANAASRNYHFSGFCCITLNEYTSSGSGTHTVYVDSWTNGGNGSCFTVTFQLQRKYGLTWLPRDPKSVNLCGSNRAVSWSGQPADTYRVGLSVSPSNGPIKSVDGHIVYP